MARFIWLLTFCLHIFRWKKWQYPPVGFHDDPLHFTPKDILFFAYKYYFRTLEKAEKNSGLEEYFLTQDFSFPEKPAGATTITLSAGGDLMPYEWVNPQATKHLWDEVGDFYFNSDIVFANLETPVFLDEPSSLTPEVMLNDMYFNGSPDLYKIYSGNGKYKGYDVLSTANNHMLDMGEDGLVQTLDFLDNKEVVAVGSASSIKEQENFPIVDREGVKVAFLGYTYSLNKLVPIAGKEHMTNYLPLNQPNADISLIIHHAKLAKARGADMVVCSLHCGCAYQAYPASHTVDLYHRVFEDAGVDVILGHHPHNPQPMEQYQFTDPFTGEEKLGFAVYSLGDFVAYDLNIFCRMPLLLKLEITKANEHAFVSGLQVLPAYIAGKKTKGGLQLQLLNLHKLGQNNFNHPFMDKTMDKEARTLHRFLRSHILPQQHNRWLAK
jgi:hypothetical protein